MLSKEIKYDVAVIGGGPAGMMAAGRAAERGLRVVLLEKNESLGKKLLITGGGRCNLTNAELDKRKFLAKFKDSDKFLFSTFAQIGVAETLDFFHKQGLETKEEEGGRVFPLSNNAQSVFDVLMKYLKSGQVEIITKAEVTGFNRDQSGQIESVNLKDRSPIQAKSFVLATGGKSHPETGSTGEGFDWLRQLGHKVISPSAALVPIRVSDTWVKTLSGISLPEAKLTLFLDKIRKSVKKGKILFTHFGLSGPAILNMSREVAELLQYGQVVISLDLLPEHDFSTLNTALQELLAKQDRKKIKNALDELTPSAFVSIILDHSNINPDTPCNSVTREERLALMKTLKDLPIHPTGLLGADKAIVTSGGIALEEVDFRTMGSRIVPNLYLVGDVLNIDRPSGGYSLQLCWTTGWVAGDSVRKPSNP